MSASDGDLGGRVSPSQAQVVNVAVRLLEQLEGAKSGEVTVPDKHNRETPDIDGLVNIGTRTFAIEHTRVEQFLDATKEHVFLSRQQAELDRMHAALLARLPPGSYELQIIGPIAARRRTVALLFDDLVAEVAKAARGVPLPPPPGPNIRTGTVSRGVDQVEYRLVRGFDPVGAPSPSLKVSVLRRFPGGDERDARLAVVTRLLEPKCTKLAPYRDQGHTTVLVLEDTAFMASPYLLLLLAGAVVRDHYADTTDMLIVVSCESDIWDLQFARTGEELDRNLFKSNWWVWDPVDQRVVQQTPERGGREAMYHARESARTGKAEATTDTEPGSR